MDRVDRRNHRRRESDMSNSNDHIHCTPDELRDIISATVKQTLLTLGIDMSDPIKLQKDFQHLREWRESTETLKKNGMIAMITIVIAGAATAFWMGVKAQMGIK